VSIFHTLAISCFSNSVSSPFFKNFSARPRFDQEPEFLNVYGAQESRKQSARQGSPAGQFDNPFPTPFLAPIDCFKILSPNFKRYGAQESASNESIPPDYVVWRAGSITLFLLRSLPS
jgi:hypothetical protein